VTTTRELPSPSIIMLDGINDGFELGVGEFDKPPRACTLSIETNPLEGPGIGTLLSQRVRDLLCRRLSYVLKVNRIGALNRLRAIGTGAHK
jgi:hypothetical protein